MMPPGLVETLIRADALLVDFDGPVCRLFASHPAATIAQQLIRTVQSVTPTSVSVVHSADPLEVIRAAATLGDQDLIVRLEDQLREAELIAAHGASPTPFAIEAIRAAAKVARRIAIVSNNSDVAITEYLTRVGLMECIDSIIGRPYAQPDLMKPSSHGISVALANLDATSDAAVLIGDSPTDIKAAKSAGVKSVGYANRPDKMDPLLAAGADAMIHGRDGMRMVAEAYRSLTSET